MHHVTQRLRKAYERFRSRRNVPGRKRKKKRAKRKRAKAKKKKLYSTGYWRKKFSDFSRRVDQTSVFRLVGEGKLSRAAYTAYRRSLVVGIGPRDGRQKVVSREKPFGRPTTHSSRDEKTLLKDTLVFCRKHPVLSKTTHSYSVTKAARWAYREVAKRSKLPSRYRQKVDGKDLLTRLPKHNHWLRRVQDDHSSHWKAVEKVIRANNEAKHS